MVKWKILYTYPCRTSRLCLFSPGGGLILEAGLLGNNGEKGGGSTTRLVHTGFPLAYCLLAYTQSVGHLVLRQPQMASQILNAPAIPLSLVDLVAATHG